MASIRQRISDTMSWDDNDVARTLEEQAWPARIRAGDDIIFEQMFRTYSARLASFADGYVRSVEIAEELVQDIFLWIWAHRNEWNPSGSVRTYLYTAIRNAALSHLRRRRLEREWEVGEGIEASDLSDRDLLPDEAVVLGEITTLINHALKKLPESRRTVVVLRWVHHLSYAEIAEIVGSNPKAVEVQLYRALRSLRQSLERHF